MSYEQRDYYPGQPKALFYPIRKGRFCIRRTQVAMQRLAAGIYLWQLVYANGRVGASEKVIIQ